MLELRAEAIVEFRLDGPSGNKPDVRLGEMSLSDTHPSIASKQLELIRGLSLERKLELTSAFSWDLIQASRKLIADEHPKWSELDVKLHWAGIHYGPDLAGRVRRYLEGR